MVTGHFSVCLLNAFTFCCWRRKRFTWYGHRSLSMKRSGHWPENKVASHSATTTAAIWAFLSFLSPFFHSPSRSILYSFSSTKVPCVCRSLVFIQSEGSQLFTCCWCCVCSLIESADREVVVVVVQETLAIKVTLSFFLSLSLKEGDLNYITIVDWCCLTQVPALFCFCCCCCCSSLAVFGNTADNTLLL